MSEKFGIDRSLRNSPAIDRKIFARTPQAVLVDDFRNIFLSHSALAADKRRQIRRSYGHCYLQGAVKGRIITDNIELVLEIL